MGVVEFPTYLAIGVADVFHARPTEILRRVDNGLFSLHLVDSRIDVAKYRQGRLNV